MKCHLKTLCPRLLPGAVVLFAEPCPGWQPFWVMENRKAEPCEAAEGSKLHFSWQDHCPSVLPHPLQAALQERKGCRECPACIQLSLLLPASPLGLPGSLWGC